MNANVKKYKNTIFSIIWSLDLTYIQISKSNSLVVFKMLIKKIYCLGLCWLNHYGKLIFNEPAKTIQIVFVAPLLPKDTNDNMLLLIGQSAPTNLRLYSSCRKISWKTKTDWRDCTQWCQKGKPIFLILFVNCILW